LLSTARNESPVDGTEAARPEEGFVLNQMERRRSPRVTAGDHPDLPPGVIDVGLGGLSIELESPLAPGTVHDVGLALRNGPEIVLRVRVAYSRREPVNGREVFVTGLAFLADVTHQSSPHTLRLAS
jgi:hypothetical protein